MNKHLLLGALLVGSTALFTACEDDMESNPTVIQPKEFKLNAPNYINQEIVLEQATDLQLTWSQPQYTTDNAPVNVVYEVQVSPSNSFTVSVDEAAADKSGAMVADYAVISRTTQKCSISLTGEEVERALQEVTGWTLDDIPTDAKAYVRVYAFLNVGMTRQYPIASNVLEMKVVPYYIVLTSADPVLWYLVGNKFADGSWGNQTGVSCVPMFLDPNCNYDKATGTGTLIYTNYFDMEGWKIQRNDFNWDYGFMGTGNPGEAVYRDGGSDKGNIWCEDGYYTVTLNTKDLVCDIKKLDITPTVYDKICITGSFANWSEGVEMTPAASVANNHVWHYTLTVAAGAVEQIKFKIAEGWGTNWGFGAYDGEVNICGAATQNGKNIGVPEGTWFILFNDIDGTFSITPLDK